MVAMVTTAFGQTPVLELTAELIAAISLEDPALLVQAREDFEEAVAAAQDILDEAQLVVSENALPLLVTDANAANYLWTNAQEPKEAPISNLVDGLTTEASFFHTQWSAPVPAITIESVTPVEGEVEAISEIIITFNAEVGAPSWDELTIYDAKCMPYVLYYQADETLAKNQIKFVLSTPITAAGEYSLEGEYLWIKDVNGKEIQGFNQTFSWIIKEADTAIDAVEAEAENAEIYDLTGRRVKEITKGGIYIINGKKTMVK